MLRTEGLSNWRSYSHFSTPSPHSHRSGGLISSLSPDFFQFYMDHLKFNQTLALVWTMNDNQDGHQNARHLSACTCGRSNLMYHFFQISLMIYFLQTFAPNSNIRYIQWTITNYLWPPKWPPPVRLTYGHSNTVIYRLISSKVCIWITFIKLSTKIGYDFVW